MALSRPRDAEWRLKGSVVAASSLTAAQRDLIYTLRQEFFRGIERDEFESNLAEKDWAVLLTDPSGAVVRGFSTLKRVEAISGGRRVIAYLSGETIIDPRFWGQVELPRVCGRHIMALAEQEQAQGARVYWFMITSSYRTYRFLPVFFREFHPRHGCETPPDAKRIIDDLATGEFGAEYDPLTGIVRFAGVAPPSPGPRYCVLCLREPWLSQRR